MRGIAIAVVLALVALNEFAVPRPSRVIIIAVAIGVFALAEYTERH